MMRGILSIRHKEWFLKKKNGMKTIAAHVVKQLKRCQILKKKTFNAACLVPGNFFILLCQDFT